MAAIELYRTRHGRYPASLDELVPEILSQPPVDPLHGLPFGYRLIPDDPHGRSYLLYSVGIDGGDDGGTEMDELDKNEYSAWAVLADPNLKGVDFVINRPRLVWEE